MYARFNNIVFFMLSTYFYIVLIFQVRGTCVALSFQPSNLIVTHLSDKVMHDNCNCGNEEIAPVVNQTVVSVMKPMADGVC